MPADVPERTDPTCSLPEDEPKLCECHGEPMWKNKSNGGWRCRVRTQERRDRGYLREYLTTRKRALGRQRDRIVNELQEVTEDAPE